MGFAASVFAARDGPNGHQCYVCEEFVPLATCLQRRNIKSCRGLEYGCETHVRYYAGPNKEMLVSSVCKSLDACSNNMNPNNVECGSECRCCCKGILCNEKKLKTACETRKPTIATQEPPTAPSTTQEQTTTTQGRTTTTQEQTTTTQKPITTAQELTTTTKVPTITSGKPTTSPTTTSTATTKPKNPCLPLPQPPIGNGTMKIVTKGEFRIATFKCDKGYCINGSNTSECTDNGWSTPAPRCEKEVCSRKQDIALVIDKSQSVKNRNFQKIKRFLKKLVKKFQDGENDMAYCIVTFGTNANQETEGFETDKKKLESAIEKMEYTTKQKEGMTCTGNGLKKAYHTCINGDGKRENSSGQLWLITDGKVFCYNDTDVTEEQKVMATTFGNKFKNKGFKLLSMAIGNESDIFKNYLEKWSKNPVVEIKKWSDMTNQAVNHVKKRCDCP